MVFDPKQNIVSNTESHLRAGFGGMPLHLVEADSPAAHSFRPAGDFWETEPEHQDYLERYPTGYTCHFVRPNWKLR
jgi:hypothetical protein